MKKTIELIFSISLFILIYFTYKGQERITLNNQHGWDGDQYYKAALQVSEGETIIEGQAPFVNRIGFNYLIGMYAKFFNKDIIDSSMQINTFAILLTVILLHLWLFKTVKKPFIRIFLILLYLFVWHSGIRNLFFDTIVTDPWGGVFFLLGLLLIYKIKQQYYNGENIIFITLILAIIVFIGTLFRESIAAISIALLFITSPIKRLEISNLKFQENLSLLPSKIITISKSYFSKKDIILLLPFIGAIITKLIVPELTHASNTGSYSYPKTIATCLYEKSFPNFFVGTFLSYGPLILLLPFYWKNIKTWLADKEELTIILLFGIFFGYFGGGDTERILFMSTFPIIFIFLSFAIDDMWKNGKVILFIVLALQSFAYRIFWNLPNYPNEFTEKPIPFFGLIGEQFNHLFLYSWHGNIYLNTILLVEYLVLFILLFTLKGKKKVIKKRNGGRK